MVNDSTNVTYASTSNEWAFVYIPSSGDTGGLPTSIHPQAKNDECQQEMLACGMDQM